LAPPFAQANAEHPARQRSEGCEADPITEMLHPTTEKSNSFDAQAIAPRKTLTL
jgi:hypothetical protein